MDISIIIPLYHGKKYVSKCREQIEENYEYLVRSGRKAEIELIFVNDFPEEKIEPEELQTDGHIFIRMYENCKNEGVHKSRIVGLSHARGAYIVFLDQDDFIEKNYLKSQLEKIGTHDAVICNGYYRDGKKIFEQEPVVHAEWLFENYKLIRSPGQVMLAKHAVPDGWKENIIVNSGADDLFLWSLLAIKKVDITFNKEFLFTHVENGKNTSFQWGKQIDSLNELRHHMKNLCQKEIYEKWEKEVSRTIAKFSYYNEIENHWDVLADADKVKRYLKTNNKKTIAVYGYGVIGKRLCRAFCREEISIRYVCDKANIPTEDGLLLITSGDRVLPADLMIITPDITPDKLRVDMNYPPVADYISLLDFLIAVDNFK